VVVAREDSRRNAVSTSESLEHGRLEAGMENVIERERREDFVVVRRRVSELCFLNKKKRRISMVHVSIGG
jgi:hypothetical protein